MEKEIVGVHLIRKDRLNNPIYDLFNIHMERCYYNPCQVSLLLKVFDPYDPIWNVPNAGSIQRLDIKPLTASRRDKSQKIWISLMVNAVVCFL